MLQVRAVLIGSDLDWDLYIGFEKSCALLKEDISYGYLVPVRNESTGIQNPCHTLQLEIQGKSFSSVVFGCEFSYLQMKLILMLIVIFPIGNSVHMTSVAEQRESERTCHPSK